MVPNFRAEKSVNFALGCIENLNISNLGLQTLSFDLTCHETLIQNCIKPIIWLSN